MTLALVLMSILASAQTEYDGRVGINTETPKASLEIARHTGLPETSVQGVLFPQLTTEQRDKFTKTDVAEGTMIFNLTKRCLEIFTQNDWNCVSKGSSTPLGVSMQVMGAGWEGVFQQGVEIPAGSGTHKVKFLIINNGATAWTGDLSSALTITNTPAPLPGGAPGPTGTVDVDGSQNSNVTVAPGTSEVVTYTLKGKPQPGSIKARLEVGIYAVEQNYSIGVGFAEFQDHSIYVFSWKEDNSVQGPRPANQTYQGKIDNSEYKIPVKIPYKNGDGREFGEFTKTVMIGTGANQRTLKLTIPGGKLHQNTNPNLYNVITGTLEVLEPTPYLAPLLEAGSADEEIASIPVQLTSATASFNLKVMATGGVKDKQYNYKTPGLNKYEHRFVYSKVMVYDQQVWLDKNLGADYADATRYLDFGNDQTYAKRFPVRENMDYKMLGSVFQWGRVADGHELVVWGQTLHSGGGGYFKYNNINQFPSGTVTDAWLRYHDTIYQTKVTTYTEPCPDGWHTPTKGEMELIALNVLGNTVGNSYITQARGSFMSEIIRLGSGDYKSKVNGVDYVDSYSTEPPYSNQTPLFWTSTSADNNRAHVTYMASSNNYIIFPQQFSDLGSESKDYIRNGELQSKARAISVRCVKD